MLEIQPASTRLQLTLTGLATGPHSKDPGENLAKMTSPSITCLKQSISKCVGKGELSSLAAAMTKTEANFAEVMTGADQDAMNVSHCGKRVEETWCQVP